ncbi:MAG: tetratricopeptide repeat protein, partial [Candidatus Limnocylindria bacterium]
LKLPHLEEAIVHVCTAVRHHPDNGLYRHNFAVLLAANAQWGQAASEARAAVRLTPNDAQTHFLLGKILRTLDDRKGQIAEYRAAIRIRPDYREAFEALGNALIEEEDWDRAVAALRAALSLKPEKPKEERSVEDLHGDIGYALRQKGDLNGALAEYRLALATGSFFSGRNHLAIGHILTEKGDLTGAIKEYREAVRLESKYGELYVVNERLYLAHALTRTGDLDGAIAEVRLVRKRRDYYDFICGARIAGMYSHVEPAFRELLQKIPNVPENREVIEFVQVILREDKCAG